MYLSILNAAIGVGDNLLVVIVFIDWLLYSDYISFRRK